MKLAIQKHKWDFLAVVGLFLLGLAVTVYILSQQNFRFPLVEETPKRISIELENAQAVQPGQGQTVRVAGIEVGRISDVQVEDGVAVVEMEIEREHEDLIRDDATALLRPKTALKDMFVEVSPGGGRVIDEGGAHPGGEHAPRRRSRRDLRGARRRHALVPEAARVGGRQGTRRAR